MATNAEYLEKVRLFERLDREKIERLALVCTRRKLDSGEMLFLEGDTPDGLFVIVSGRMRIERVAENGVAQVIAIRKAGDVIGEMGMIDGHPRSAQAVAQTKCRLLFLGKDAFRSYILEEPAISFVLMQTLSFRIRESAQMLLDTRSKPVHERLHDYLVSQADEDGRVEVEVSQATLSEYLGCTREAVNRAFRTLEEEEKIRRQGRRIFHVGSQPGSDK